MIRMRSAMPREKASSEKAVVHPTGRRPDGFLASMHRSLRVQDVLATASEAVMRCFGFDGTDIHLRDAETGTLRLASRAGLSQDFIQETSHSVDSGPAGSILKSGKPLFLRIYPESSGREVLPTEPDGVHRQAEDGDLRQALNEAITFAGVAITKKEGVAGVLSCHSNFPRILSAEDRILLEEWGHQLGIALGNAGAFEQAEQKAHRYIAISRVITATRHLGTLDWVLQEITKVLVQGLGFDMAWIGLIGESEWVLGGRAGFGACMSSKSIHAVFPLEVPARNPVHESAVNQTPVVCRDADSVEDASFRQWLKRIRAQSFAFAPILNGDVTLGVIGVFYLGDQVFQEEDVRTLTSVSEQAANAIENAELYDKIKTSEERYRTLFESAGTGLVILDPHNQFRLVNHAFESLSGYSRDELVGKMSFFQFFSGKTQLPLLYAEDGDGSEAAARNREFLLQDRHGNQRHVHILTDRIPGSSDLLVSLIDMTRERELERRLFKSEELASIGELSAGIAHEIRNPLVAITTSVSLLKDETELSADGRQVLDVVKEETDHLAAIVDDFLKFARPKKTVLRSEDLNRLVKDVIRRHREMGRKDIRWEEEYDDRLPEIPLDRHQFQQVITNLTLNALDAMPGGGTLTFRTRLDDRTDRPRAALTVLDTGAGIPESDRTKIFQPFYSTKEKGTGMGLAICRRIVTEHDGEIFVESEPDRGAAFTVSLPLEIVRPTPNER
jgi:PAS domain S-box-containing protein